MTYRPFVLPPDSEFEAILGMTPEPRGEVGGRGLVIPASNGFELDLTIDLLSRAVTLSVRYSAVEIAQITRDGATDVHLSRTTPEMAISFRTDDTTGKIEITLNPSLHVVETALFT